MTPLVIAAHGSADPRFAAVVEEIAREVARLRPGLDVRIGYLDHGPPHLRDVVGGGVVAVPLLLSAGYHVRSDIPAQAPDAVVTTSVGPHPRLADVLMRRLHAAGWTGGAVVLAAAGSSDERALDDVRIAAGQLSERINGDVTAAFVSAGSPRLDDVLRAEPDAAVATYLIAPGAFHEAMRASGARIVSDPIGADPVVAEIVLDRYDAAQVPGRTAPA